MPGDHAELQVFILNMLDVEKTSVFHVLHLLMISNVVSETTWAVAVDMLNNEQDNQKVCATVSFTLYFCDQNH